MGNLSLKSYDRFIRLYQKFINPLLKPALIFQQSSIKLFTHFNLFLQRDEPNTYTEEFNGDIGKKNR